LKYIELASSGAPGQNVTLIQTMKARAIAANDYLSNFQDYVQTAGNNLKNTAEYVLDDEEMSSQHSNAETIDAAAIWFQAWTAEKDAINAVILGVDQNTVQAYKADRTAVKSTVKLDLSVSTNVVVGSRSLLDE